MSGFLDNLDWQEICKRNGWSYEPRRIQKKGSSGLVSGVGKDAQEKGGLGSPPSLNNFYGNNSAVLGDEWDIENFKAKLWKCVNEFRVYTCKKCHLLHARPRWCKDRFCPKCAKYLSRRAKKAIKAIVKEQGLWERGSRHKLKFITLTCENFPERMVIWGLERLNIWFANLVRRSIWKKNMRGWLKRIEVTKGQDGNYHLHIHVLAEGSFIPQSELSDIWRDILSKDDWRGVVVDIREVKGVGKAIKEIAKYCFKPNGLSIEDKAFLSKSFTKRRLYSFGGLWAWLLKGVDIEDLDNESKYFVCVCGSKEFEYKRHGDMLRSEMTGQWRPYMGGFIFVPDSS